MTQEDMLLALLLGRWTIETDCGPCLRLVRRTEFTDLPDVEGEWIYPPDAGLPRYCNDWDGTLRILLPLAIKSIREHLEEWRPMTTKSTTEKLIECREVIEKMRSTEERLARDLGADQTLRTVLTVLTDILDALLESDDR